MPYDIMYIHVGVDEHIFQPKSCKILKNYGCESWLAVFWYFLLCVYDYELCVCVHSQ